GRDFPSASSFSRFAFCWRRVSMEGATGCRRGFRGWFLIGSGNPCGVQPDFGTGCRLQRGHLPQRTRPSTRGTKQSLHYPTEHAPYALLPRRLSSLRIAFPHRADCMPRLFPNHSYHDPNQCLATTWISTDKEVRCLRFVFCLRYSAVCSPLSRRVHPAAD